MIASLCARGREGGREIEREREGESGARWGKLEGEIKKLERAFLSNHNESRDGPW